MDKIQNRWCKKCKEYTLHDIIKPTPLAEKIFLGIITLGMIPLIDAIDKRNYNNIFTIYTKCQKCKNKKRIS